MSIPEEGYSRNASCTLNLISTFFFINSSPVFDLSLHVVILLWVYWIHLILVCILILNLFLGHFPQDATFLPTNFELACILQRSCYPGCTCTWITIIHNKSFHPCNRFLWFEPIGARTHDLLYSRRAC